MNKYKVCIFDLDGTLLDTIASMAYSANLVMKELGLTELPRENFRYYAGDGAEELVRRCLKDAGDMNCQQLNNALPRYKKVFGENCLYQVKPYQGITELLENLKKSGQKITVLSNKPHAATIDVVEKIFGAGYFDYIQGQQDGIPHKPDPAGALFIAKRYGVTPGECLYIGDTDTDMQTGNGAGMDTVGVLWGFRTREELVENHAKMLAAHPAEIWERLND